MKYFAVLLAGFVALCAIILPGHESAVADAKPSFDGVKSWGPLRWSMSVDAAEKALADVGYAPRRVLSRAPGPDPGTADATETYLTFSLRGWTGAVRFAKGGRISVIELAIEGVTENIVASELAAFEAKYGKPRKRTALPTARGLEYENDSTGLAVSALRREDASWAITETWRPAKGL